MKVVFLTVHDATSARKVDFHFWADVLASRGIAVDFVTVGFSPITMMKKGGRKYQRPFNEWVRIDDNRRKFMWCPPFHPFGVGSKLLTKITSRIFSLYPRLMSTELLAGISDVKIFVVENGAGLVLIPALAKKFPDARFIYSVCDRISTLNYHPIIVQAEKEALSHIDLIRVPAKVMIGDYDPAYNIQHIPHGLDKKMFDVNLPSPYTSRKNVVGVGDMLFDAVSIRLMAENFSDWTFHLFGKNAFLNPEMPNVVAHGEWLFADIIPFIKHADIGLAAYRPAPDADYLSQSSMKMIQYTYCQLPIVAPEFAAAGREHIMGYIPGDKASIIKAMNAAMVYARSAIDNSKVLDWEKTVDAMFGNMPDAA